MSELIRRIKANIIEYAKPSWDLKTGHFVPSDQKRFLECEVWKLRWVFKYFKRKLYMRLIGQHKKELSHIPSTTKSVLWINLSAPSLGDSLMDLSGRQLLTGFNLDLLTDSKNASLYQNDPFFKNVFVDADELQNHQYDLVILDAYSPRILKIKSRILPNQSFVGLWGYVNGFEAHRTLYSFYRMQFLLQNNQTLPKLAPLMGVPDFFDAGLSPKKSKLAIVVGAEWDYRRYSYWSEVIAEVVHEYGDAFEILLIGSSNGVAEAEEISLVFPQCKNFVGKCTLSETSSLIEQSNIVLAADGGLWHIACALNKPSVVLFANMPVFDEDGLRVTRETKDIVCNALYAENFVSQIKVEEVLQALKSLLSAIEL